MMGAALSLFILAAAPSAPTTPAAVDVADISTRICYGLAAGTLTLPAEIEAQGKALASLGLSAGIDQQILDQLGPLGTAIVSRAAMANKANGTAHSVVAVGGSTPGCRVALTDTSEAPAAEAVATALAAQGWKLVPSMTAARGPVERRAFLRRDAQNKPYLLNLITLLQPSNQLRLFTSVAAIPPNVTIPEGF